MLLRAALKRERTPLTDDDVHVKRQFVVVEILRVFKAVLLDLAVVPQSQFFTGCKSTPLYKDWPWINELPWNFISISACAPKSVLDCLRYKDVVDDAFRSEGFHVASNTVNKHEAMYRIVPLTLCTARTVKELDLLWSLGLTHWKNRHFRMPRQVYSECTCWSREDDLYCVMHSHAALIECGKPNAMWAALRARFTPLRAAWFAACVAPEAE
jgi:hypothetical protein